MNTISLCMIVKNEEDVLARCLSCVQDIVDEIIIVDTGSTDQTCNIARQFTEQVYHFEWNDNFSDARNEAFSKATKDYCMWLDADDVIQEKDRLALLNLKKTLDPTTDIVMMQYQTKFDEDGTPTFYYYRERWIRNRAGFLWKGAVHESIAPSGKILYSDIAVCHKKIHCGNPDRNLNIFKKMISEGATLDAREQFYYSRELFYHEKYREAIHVLNQFFDSDAGWIENKLDACRLAANCYRNLGEDKFVLPALLKSFEYGKPRAEICCDLGDCFLKRDDYKTASFWYQLALQQTPEDKSGGFIDTDYYGYLPSIQLCVCFDRLGDFQTANQYNEKAGQYKPDSAAYLYNKDYFHGKLSKI